MNLLITGGCGFIGSNFINYYFPKANINRLVNIDAMYYCASEENVNEDIRKSPLYTFVKGNLQSYELVDYVIRSNNITHIIHFAAQSHVENSFEDSLLYTCDNILGTHTLLEVCRKYNKIEKFIHVSTDEVYGESMLNTDEQHKTENSVLCPTNPYAATKAGAELLAQSYYHSFKMPIIISRGNNVYGPNQYPEKLIPRFIKLLKEDKKVTIQGDGSCVRAFLHSYDTARAFESILNKGKIGEIYNIGCDEGMEYSVMDIAKILIKKLKNTENYDEWITYIPDRPYNDKRYYISNQKLKDLGWDVIVDLESGLNDLCFTDSKINFIELCKLNTESHKELFGDWINNIKELKQKFNSSEPVKHIIIDNFLNEEYANIIHDNFPLDLENWHHYHNPIEVKYANDKINDMNENIRKLFYVLSTNELTNIFSEISEIDNLEYDRYLHGAGLHCHPRYGRLNIHLDYEKHPLLHNKERRLNIILYLTKDWKEEWNGDTELWDKDMTKCMVKSPVKFNSAIIFQTNEISLHGLPEKIMCPEGLYRKSFAYYYISPLVTKEDKNKIGNDGSGYRTKATFIKRPEDPDYPELKRLYEIRPKRRIEKEDLEKIWPEWTPELF